jgi:SH3 domain-containing protein
MGQLKLRPDAGAASGRYPAGVLEDPKPIAQRFAHSAELRAAPSHRTESARASPRPAAAPAQDPLALRTRLLLGGLILAALIPSLILGALALGLIAMPGSDPETAAAPQAATASAVLTVPDRIEAVAGGTVSFPIALDGTDGMPPRSVVAITGLPQGSSVSEGRPYGDNEWNLRPDQIGDLKFAAPADVQGEFKLGVALIAPEGKAIAAAESLLAIAPAPVPAEPPVAATSGGPSSEVDDPAASAAVPDGGEATAAIVAPDAGGNAVADGTPTTIEAATAATGDVPPDTVEPPTEQAAAPTGETQPNALGQAEDAEPGLGTVEPSMFVNMREAPSSSSTVLGVIAKGVKLPVLDRKRGWVQVTDPATGNKGWIYSGLLAGEAKPYARRKRAAPAEAESKSDSFWSRLGGWLSPSDGN